MLNLPAPSQREPIFASPSLRCHRWLSSCRLLSRGGLPRALRRAICQFSKLCSPARAIVRRCHLPHGRGRRCRRAIARAHGCPRMGEAARSPIFADICAIAAPSCLHLVSHLVADTRSPQDPHKIPTRSPPSRHKILWQTPTSSRDTHKIGRHRDSPRHRRAIFTAPSPRSPMFTAPSPCDSPRVRDIAARDADIHCAIAEIANIHRAIAARFTATSPHEMLIFTAPSPRSPIFIAPSPRGSPRHRRARCQYSLRHR